MNRQKMHMTLALLVWAALTLSLAGCGGKGGDKSARRPSDTGAERERQERDRRHGGANSCGYRLLRNMVRTVQADSASLRSPEGGVWRQDRVPEHRRRSGTRDGREIRHIVHPDVCLS